MHESLGWGALFLVAPNWSKPTCPSRTAYSDMEKSHRRDSEGKKAGTKEDTQHGAISKRFKKKEESLVLEVRVVITPGGEWYWLQRGLRGL